MDSTDGNAPEVTQLDRAELVELAEHESAERLGVSVDEARAKLERGELDGTIAEAELRMLDFLLGEPR
jgi:hypothetical protein